MGCLHSQSEITQDSTLRKTQSKEENSAVGKLVITIENVYLEKIQNKDVKKSDLLLKVRLSNQDQQIKLDELKKQHEENKKFAFSINSCYKSNGRFLILEVWNLKGKNQTDTGLGFVNLNYILSNTLQNQKYLKRSMKTFINYSKEPGGFIEFQLEFMPYDYDELTLKINSIFLHRHVEGKKFSAKICIGQQTLNTETITANQRNQLIWKDQAFTFRVPSFIQFGLLKVVQKKGSSDLFWGQYKLDVKQFLKTNNYHQVQIDDQLQYENTVSGKVRLSSTKGNLKNFSFRQIDSPTRARRNQTSIKVLENPSVTDQHLESTKECLEVQNLNFSVYRTSRASSLPPLNLNEALKKLQFKRKQKQKNFEENV